MEKKKRIQPKQPRLAAKAMATKRPAEYASPRLVAENGSILSDRDSVPPVVISMKIKSIDIGKRYRKDLGKLGPLAESIREKQLLHPVVVSPGGHLIAGWRRIEACKLLGWTEVPATVLDLEEIKEGELHENCLRKKFLPSEVVAIKRALEPLEESEARKRQGFRSDLQLPAIVAERREKAGERRVKIASLVGMSHETLKRAEVVVIAAEQEPEEYGHLVEQMDQSGNVAGAFLRLNVLRQAKKINASPSVMPSGPFQVIVGDPPWPYASGGDLPYPPMDIESIKKMRVADMADENTILWLWTTNTHLRVAFEVIEAWGFQYRTMLTWAKDQVGTGQYLRGQTEHCLLATKGNPIFVKGKWSTLLEAKRREHSRKPDEFYELVEATCPGHKVELFSRQHRPGWEAYGNDVNKFKTA